MRSAFPSGLSVGEVTACVVFAVLAVANALFWLAVLAHFGIMDL